MFLSRKALLAIVHVLASALLSASLPVSAIEISSHGQIVRKVDGPSHQASIATPGSLLALGNETTVAQEGPFAGRVRMTVEMLFLISLGSTISCGMLIMGCWWMYGGDVKAWGSDPFFLGDDYYPGEGKGKGKGKIYGKGEGFPLKGKSKGKGAGFSQPVPDYAQPAYAQPAYAQPASPMQQAMEQAKAATDAAAEAAEAEAAKAEAAKAEAAEAAKAETGRGKVPQEGARAPTERMKMALTVNVANGKDMPSVNTFGGCDPFVEVRCVKGDPLAKIGGIELAAVAAGQTKAIDNEMNPTWNETVTLSQATYSEKHFINIILWDAGVAAHTPIGYHSVATNEFLSGLEYDPQANKAASKKYQATQFKSLMPDLPEAIKSIVNLSVSFLEIHKFQIKVKKASHLPKVDMIGSIDAYVEFRLVQGDPTNMEYQVTPGPETLWSGKTHVINDNMDPTFNQELSFVHAADPNLTLIACISDEGRLGDTPIGMVVVPMKKLCCNQNGAQDDYKLKLTKIPNWDAHANLKLASLSFSISHDLALA